MKVGDKVTVTCEYIPGTKQPCEGKKAVITNIASYDNIEVRFEGDSYRTLWYFGEQDFAPRLAMTEPEFSLDEIHEGQDLCTK